MASFSHFFIDRPIFATVVSIVITLTGAIALVGLPIAQYPPIVPPAIQVSINYPGASAQVVADTVAAPIEQQVNGVEGMLYMSSQMGNDGSYSLGVTFDVGTDLNTALVMVQNRVALAMPILPTPVQNQGITIRKRTPDILMIVNFLSPDGRYDDLYLSNYATINVRDEVLRVDGVSDVIIFGQRDYSMRVWLDPQKMASWGVNAGDVANAIRRENLDLPAGSIGQPPSGSGQSAELPIDTLGRLITPEQFADIIVKVDQGLSTQSTATGGGTPTMPSPIGSSLPSPGRANPLQTGSIAGRTGGNAGGMGSSNLRSNANSSAPSATTNTASSNGAFGGVSTSGGGSSGGVSTAGGGSAGGSNTTSGSGTSNGESGSASNNTMAGQNLSNGSTGEMSGLSINTSTAGAVSGSGAIATTAAAGQPLLPAVGIVRLRDVGRIEMGAQNYRQAMSFDGHPSIGVAVFQLPGTNALEVADRVKKKMLELKTRFPDGVTYDIAYDTTPFIRESVADVFKTLLIAAGLVALVVLVFLQNWRSVLIPMIAMPVAIIGTFGVMAAVGFSLNNISLFGLVLAIGIVVDDAIVVVENIERWLERGLEPRDATYHAMSEVTGPVIAVALVLCAVFVPCAFISGITGRFFRQFAVTIAASTVFSAINSLTLTPALSAIMLKPKREKDNDPVTRVLHFSLGWFFRLFEKTFNASTAGYAWTVGRLLRINLLVVIAYGGLLALTYWVFDTAPRGFIPQQDQGRIMAGVQLPDSSSLERTQKALRKIDEIARSIPGVEHTLTVAGMSFVQSATGSNFASLFLTLEPFEKRTAPDRSDMAIIGQLMGRSIAQVKDAQLIAFPAPPIPGLSAAGGFTLMVEDRGGLGLTSLDRQTANLVTELNNLKRRPETPATDSRPNHQGTSEKKDAQPALKGNAPQEKPKTNDGKLLAGVSTQFRSATPQLFMDIDRTKVASLGIPLTDVNQTLSIYLGSLYVNSFNAFGRHWQVNVQAEGDFRNGTDDITTLQVRNNQGQMVQLGALGEVREINGPIFVNRYNLYTAASVRGNLTPGVSSGDVIQAVDKLAKQTLPISMNKDWTELMYMQIREGNTAIIVFFLSVVCVFLVLAALYESWSLPLAVILVVPLCLLCSVLGAQYLNAKDQSVNIFVQIGLVVLVGLACKNSILIVEFAKRLREEGKTPYFAAQEASRLRLRPILMTSFSFIFGVIPLVIATGAGSEMRRALGTAVFSGMLGVTLFGIFLTPVFFYVIDWIGNTRFFSSPAMQKLGKSSLDLLTAGLSRFTTIVRNRPDSEDSSSAEPTPPAKDESKGKEEEPK